MASLAPTPDAVRARWRAGLLRALPLLVPFALAFLFYAPVLPLPYAWDDFPTFAFATTKTLRTIWTDATGLPYYRPLAYTLYKLIFAVVGVGAPFWPHVLNVALHALNSVLVGALAARAVPALAPQRAHQAPAAALVAGALFALYPFAALPVALFASLVHLLVTTLALAAALALLAYRRGGHWGWLALALVAAALAPCVHESGIVVGLLAALAAWVIGGGAPRRTLWPLGLVAVIGGVFLPAWALVPKTREATGSLLDAAPWDAVLAKVTFFFQAPTYPAQPLAAILMQRAGWWDLGAILLVGGAALLAVGALLAAHWRWRWLALALGWTFAAALPSIAALTFAYMVTSPRLLYLPGPGAVLLWTAAALDVHHRLRPAWARAAGLALLAGLTLAVPAAYLRRETHLHTLALTPLRQLAAFAQQYPHERHLAVNPVKWLAYATRWYTLGHDGVNVLTPYSGLADLIHLNSGVRWAGGEVTFADLLPSGYGYYISTSNEAPDQLLNMDTFTALAGDYDRVYLTTYTANAAAVREVGQVAPGRAQPGAYLGNFEDALYLTAGRVWVEGQTAVVALDWRYRGPDLGATVFRNIFDCDGNVLGLGSGAPLGGLLALGALPPESAVRDLRHIALDALSPTGCYQAEVGLFRPDGTRVTVLAPDGTPYENFLVLLRTE